MGRKRKLRPDEKAEKKRRKELYTTVFVGGKQKRVKRSRFDGGLSKEEFLKRQGGPIALHQAGLWHLFDNEAFGAKFRDLSQSIADRAGKVVADQRPARHELKFS